MYRPNYSRQTPLTHYIIFKFLAITKPLNLDESCGSTPLNGTILKIVGTMTSALSLDLMFYDSSCIVFLEIVNNEISVSSIGNNCIRSSCYWVCSLESSNVLTLKSKTLLGDPLVKIVSQSFFLLVLFKCLLCQLQLYIERSHTIAWAYHSIR